MVAIRIDHNSKMPVYRQIYNEIVFNIASGKLKPGDALPSLRVMAGTLDVNYHTVNEAYEMLINDGIIKLSKNRKYIVSPSGKDENAREKLREEAGSFIDKAFARGFSRNDVESIVRDELNRCAEGGQY